MTRDFFNSLLAIFCRCGFVIVAAEVVGLMRARHALNQPPLLSMQPYFAQSSGFRLRPSAAGFPGAGT